MAEDNHQATTMTQQRSLKQFDEVDHITSTLTGEQPQVR